MRGDRCHIFNMATVNRESLREQLDLLEEQHRTLRESGSLSKESEALFSSMLLLLKLMCSLFLERTTKKTPKNSHLPSSQSNEDKTAKDGTGRSGKESTALKHEDAPSSSSESSVTIELLTVDECACCGEDLSAVAPENVERRTLIDIVFEKRVLHQDSESKICPACQTCNKAAFDKEFSAPLRYGLGMKAFVLHLMVTQLLPLKRLLSTVGNLFQVAPAEKTLIKWLLNLHKSLTDWEEEATRRLLLSPVLNTDETSLRVLKKNWWVHVYSAGGVTLRKLHKKRGKDAMNEFGIITEYAGTIVHDCWSSYLSYDNCQHALCGSHLLRELKFIIDSNDYRWAKNMKRLLQATAQAVSESDEKALSPKAYTQLLKNYRNILTRGTKELPVQPTRPKGKRGRIARTDAENLHLRLRKYESEVLRFALEPMVPFTNNLAERELRMTKVKQKISGCFRSEEMAQAYCRVSSYLRTMKALGVNPMIALEGALKGQMPEW